jgi:hypothetical protein
LSSILWAGLVLNRHCNQTRAWVQFEKPPQPNPPSHRKWSPSWCSTFTDTLNQPLFADFFFIVIFSSHFVFSSSSHASWGIYYYYYYYYYLPNPTMSGNRTISYGYCLSSSGTFCLSDLVLSGVYCESILQMILLKQLKNIQTWTTDSCILRIIFVTEPFIFLSKLSHYSAAESWCFNASRMSLRSPSPPYVSRSLVARVTFKDTEIISERVPHPFCKSLYNVLTLSGDVK